MRSRGEQREDLRPSLFCSFPRCTQRLRTGWVVPSSQHWGLHVCMLMQEPLPSPNLSRHLLPARVCIDGWWEAEPADKRGPTNGGRGIWPQAQCLLYCLFYLPVLSSKQSRSNKILLILYMFSRWK